MILILFLKGMVNNYQIQANRLPRGNFHMKGAGMLVGNFELNP